MKRLKRKKQNAGVGATENGCVTRGKSSNTQVVFNKPARDINAGSSRWTNYSFEVRRVCTLVKQPHLKIKTHRKTLSQSRLRGKVLPVNIMRLPLLASVTQTIEEDTHDPYFSPNAQRHAAIFRTSLYGDTSIFIHSFTRGACVAARLPGKENLRKWKLPPAFLKKCGYDSFKHCPFSKGS